ncbi:MAG: ATP-grasp domain-containing protein, partial [Gammaproteobacteria bacterium]|nr:ATP-grasp domain-containing protein [Gammaproteobacteria bacterium]
MFSRLLIANRGEIACRVIRTARRLGLATIAVYSDADAGARHVRLADEAHRLGPAPARESYLSIGRVLEAATAAGAEAIHPGYGFLSENAGFASDCAERGLMFVGPPPAAIAAMGSKIAAKEAMRRAGVPVLPGYQGEDQSAERLRREALALGFPLIIKPSGGGGGKGMQIVAEASQLDAALESARRVASSAFADPALLLERYLQAPRHVEVQVLCDGHGHALHLGTRDCSVQRRHQKLIEEAPAPDLPEDLREHMHAAALTVARAVGYQGAGTVEFLYADGRFWFMEMNTRLQVEHGVTERVFGLDLVEWQLRVAAGEALPFAQGDLVPRGHAIEARVCAEDPAEDFRPSAGPLTVLRWPPESATLRVDAGFESGDQVPSHYDSLLGKLIASGPDRREAARTLLRAIETLRVGGVRTNAAWLAAALASPAFVEATPTTRFVAEQGEALSAPTAVGAAELAVAALEIAGAGAESIGGPVPSAAAEPLSPWAVRDAFRVNLPATQCLVLVSGGRELPVAITRERDAWSVASELGVCRIGFELPARPADAQGSADLRSLGAWIGGVRRRIEVHRHADRVSL